MQKAVGENENAAQKLSVKRILFIVIAFVACSYGQDTPREASLGKAAFVDSDQSLSAEIIIGGDSATDRTVLIRALGPSLGIADALQDPTLEIRDANGILASDDDWQSNQEGAIRTTGLAPQHEKESAIIVGLGVGRYTATVRGKDGAKGRAVVEAYILK